MDYIILKPKLGKLEFGNVEQINIIKRYQALCESDLYKIRITATGSYEAVIKANSPEEAEEKAWKEGSKIFGDACEVQTCIVGKEIPDVPITKGQLNLFERVI